MSRKAKLPIECQKGVEAEVKGKVVTLKGPKGSLSQEVKPFINVSVDKSKISVELAPGHESAKNFLGLYWSLLNNMAKGVSEGYSKKLEMIGVGYRAAVQGDLLDLQIGISHPLKLKIPDGLKVTVEKSTLITVTGIDKQLVGQFSATIRATRPPEPYKGKGIRYSDEYVRRKAGKAGKK